MGKMKPFVQSHHTDEQIVLCKPVHCIGILLVMEVIQYLALRL